MKNLILKLKFFFYCINLCLRGGEEMVIKSWIICLTGGIFFWPDVPKVFRERLRKELKEIGAEDLITE